MMTMIIHSHMRIERGVNMKNYLYKITYTAKMEGANIVGELSICAKTDFEAYTFALASIYTKLPTNATLYNIHLGEKKEL